MNKLKWLTIFFAMVTSLVYGGCFEKDSALIQTFRANNVKIIVLYNYEGTNNVLNIVTASRSPGYCLTDQGKENLQNDIPALQLQDISYIYAAPAFRTQQTANILGAALRLRPANLLVDARLGMQNFGDFDGMNYDLYKRYFGTQAQMLQGTPPNGEDACAVYNRINSFLISLTKHQESTILIISHAFNYCQINKVLSGQFKSVPLPGAITVYDFANH